MYTEQFCLSWSSNANNVNFVDVLESYQTSVFRDSVCIVKEFSVQKVPILFKDT